MSVTASRPVAEAAREAGVIAAVETAVRAAAVIAIGARVAAGAIVEVVIAARGVK